MTDERLPEDSYVDLILVITDDGGTIAHYQSMTGCPWEAKAGQTEDEILEEMAQHESTKQYYQQSQETWLYKDGTMYIDDKDGHHECDCYLEHFGWGIPLYLAIRKLNILKGDREHGKTTTDD